MIDNGSANTFEHSLRNFGCTLSKPIALFVSNLFKYLSTIISLNSGSWQLHDDVSIIVGLSKTSLLENTDAKKPFRVSAIFLPFVSIEPSFD